MHVYIGRIQSQCACLYAAVVHNVVCIFAKQYVLGVSENAGSSHRKPAC